MVMLLSYITYKFVDGISRSTLIEFEMQFYLNLALENYVISGSIFLYRKGLSQPYILRITVWNSMELKAISNCRLGTRLLQLVIFAPS